MGVIQGRDKGSGYKGMFVTAKMATPTKVDSKLSDAHLELLKRREEEGECH